MSLALSVEHALNMKLFDHFAGALARVGVKIVELVLRQARSGIFPVTLKTTLNPGGQVGSRVYHDIVAAAEAVAIKKERGLVHPVDHTIGGDILHGTAQPCKGGKQVGDMQNITDDLPRLDHTGPGSQTGYAHASFGKVTLSACIKGFHHTSRAEMDKRSVIGHDDNQRILGNAFILQMMEQFAEKLVKRHQSLRQKIFVGGGFAGITGIREERSQDGVVRDEKRFLGGHGFVDEGKGALLGFSNGIPVVAYLGGRPPLISFAIFGALEGPHRTARLP